MLTTFILKDNLDLDSKIKVKLKKMYPKLVSHFNWFLKTQHAISLDPRRIFYSVGVVDPIIIPTSGLDDYPVETFPSEYRITR